jgi:hypothetical protein
MGIEEDEKVVSTDFSSYKHARKAEDPSVNRDSDEKKSSSLLLTTEEVAYELRISPVTVKMSRCSGVLLGYPAPPFVKLGRCIRYRRNDLSEWLDKITS